MRKLHKKVGHQLYSNVIKLLISCLVPQIQLTRYSRNMTHWLGSFQCARGLLTLPPSLRTAFYQQQCQTRYAALSLPRLASSASRATARSIKPSKANATAASWQPNLQPRTGYKVAEAPRPAAYANFVDSLVSRASGRNEPFLLYKAPSHTNYYIACGFMSTCFAFAALACANIIIISYDRRLELWWQLPLEGVATGVCLLFWFRASMASRRLIHELWLLPRAVGKGASGPRMVEIKCRAWPLPFGRDRTWTAPLDDITLSRSFGSTFYAASPERGGRHSIASTTAQDAAEYKMLLEQERKDNGAIVTRLLAAIDQVKAVYQECKQVLHWYGINAYMVVEGKGSFKLDGRGLMLQGGKGMSY